MEHNECNNYNVYKTVLELELYLVCLSFYDRKRLAKFRCRSNFLPVNKPKYKDYGLHSIENGGEGAREGRHDPSTDCELCHRQETGDEIHYLFICPFFEFERERFIEQKYREGPNILSMTELFSSEDPTVLQKLSCSVGNVMDYLKDMHIYDL